LNAVHTTGTIVIGAGQAGLSLSRHLAAHRHPHIVLERGRVGERWRSRWESLRLLTPGWLNRLDGGASAGEPDGFAKRTVFVDYLESYARSFGAPVRELVEVLAVEQHEGGLRVATDRGTWHARNVVVATGDAAEPRLPAAAAAAPGRLLQLHASRYWSPTRLPPGGVLVVGAGPSGQQIAAELRRAGRAVVLAVGRHARMPRRYRGRDIWCWLRELGYLEQTVDELPDPAASRRAPSLVLTGANAGEQLDLAVLDRLGVTVAGRLLQLAEGRAVFAPDLHASVEDAERRMQRVLDRIDAQIDDMRAESPPEHVPEVRLPQPPGDLDLAAAGISTVIWATGYRREYPWLHVPVLDAGGELEHRHGVTATPGLYVLGLKHQRRRASHFIGGVGADAAFLARLIVRPQPTAATPSASRAAARSAVSWPSSNAA
jgi:putative flavoprotein involved in K+ transport